MEIRPSAEIRVVEVKKLWTFYESHCTESSQPLRSDITRESLHSVIMTAIA